MGNGGTELCCLMRIVEGDGLVCGDYIKGSSHAVLLLTAATSFRDGAGYRQVARDKLDKAQAKGYETLKDEYLADFCPLMERCTLTLPTDKALLALPYDKRLERVRSGESNLGLVADMFTMGRYLMATGSRPGSMPLNLQGIGNQSYRPPWDSKYTININAEMNYWPAESCHLSEMHLPLFAHMQRMLPQGRRVAQEMYGTRGWVAHHNTDVWGDCAPQDSSLSSTVWQIGAAWLSLHIMEHYRFTMDEGFLAEYYPSWRRPPCSS